jgi:hypothetical protein
MLKNRGKKKKKKKKNPGRIADYDVLTCMEAAAGEDWNLRGV